VNALGRFLGGETRREVLGHLGGVILAALSGLVAGILAHIADPAYGGAGFWIAIALQLVATPVLLLARRAPMAVTLVTALVALLLLAPWPIAQGASFSFFNSIDPWIPLALTTVGALALPDLDRRRTALGLTAIGIVTVVAARPWDPSLSVISSGLLHTAAPTLLGLYVMTRRRLVQALRDRADRAEREQALVAERTRADERARLAAEMHDVVTHRVTLMVLQAGALGVTASDAATRRAAEELRATGSEALDELRDVVGVLRRGGDPEPASGTGREEAPAPNVASLVDASRAVGMQVELRLEGDPSLASPVVGRTVFRVVQEGLTNVRKHAPRAAVHVEVRYAADNVRVSVVNGQASGPGDDILATSGSGTGLIGLRRRVELVGGNLRVGPAEGGGFRIASVLPSFVATAGSTGGPDAG
jgi:signal transduction histidine kinase